MFKKKYVKRLYIEVAICDKCGSEMEPAGYCLTSYPVKYPYVCSNPNCDGRQTLLQHELPGQLKWEYAEDEEDV